MWSTWHIDNWDCMIIHATLLKSKLMICNMGRRWLRLWVCSCEAQCALELDEQIAVTICIEAAAAVANCVNMR